MKVEWDEDGCKRKKKKSGKMGLARAFYIRS